MIVYTSVAVKVDDTALPGDFALLQNHPNPFNPTTTIRYSLSRPHLVQIEVYNVLGQLVSTLENSEQGVGVYETTWDGTNANGQNVASGVYFYRLKAGEFVQTCKMVLSR
ncbi:MAG: T9SS type A sorting domain-containing protein [bacterium]|nr:T9SS type A sorting domain-containing protein [bacterium]